MVEEKARSLLPRHQFSNLSFYIKGERRKKNIQKHSEKENDFKGLVRITMKNISHATRCRASPIKYLLK